MQFGGGAEERSETYKVYVDEPPQATTPKCARSVRYENGHYITYGKEIDNCTAIKPEIQSSGGEPLF